MPNTFFFSWCGEGSIKQVKTIQIYFTQILYKNNFLFLLIFLIVKFRLWLEILQKLQKKIRLSYKVVAVIGCARVFKMTRWKEEKRKECYLMTNKLYFYIQLWMLTFTLTELTSLEHLLCLNSWHWRGNNRSPPSANLKFIVFIRCYAFFFQFWEGNVPLSIFIHFPLVYVKIAGSMATIQFT